ncbi:MAG: HAD-IIIA family hydrolase [Bacteroidia bacterium]|nr:MAG: HAD-IIIA family hydrolase [Bacteroidia bacterium]
MHEATESPYTGWSLFLDRDGVLNQRPGKSYVTHPDQFIWIQGSLESMPLLAKTFRYIFIITNQQGIGKGLMTENDLKAIHEKMMQDIMNAGGRIDKIYQATGMRHLDSFRRKPGEGMGLEARNDFPIVDFRKSWMVGDTLRDMLFGQRLQMTTALIAEKTDFPRHYLGFAGYRFLNLTDFATFIQEKV